MLDAPFSRKLWDIAYGLHEREKRWIDDLPRALAARAPEWPVTATVAIDVGASVGTYTRSFATWCERVYALEPQTSLGQALKRAAPPNVSVHVSAAGARPARGHMTDTRAKGSRRPLARLGDPAGAAWSEPCEIVRIDSLLDSSPRALVVKIDTEGSECCVIEGMGALTDLRNLILMVEIERRHNPGYGAVFERLGEAGLKAFRVVAQRLVPAVPVDVERAAKGPGGRLASLWPWSNNFIFLRPALALQLGGKGGVHASP